MMKVIITSRKCVAALMSKHPSLRGILPVTQDCLDVNMLVHKRRRAYKVLPILSTYKVIC